MRLEFILVALDLRPLNDLIMKCLMSSLCRAYNFRMQTNYSSPVLAHELHRVNQVNSLPKTSKSIVGNHVLKSYDNLEKLLKKISVHHYVCYSRQSPKR